ncbi:MAG TPA: hypothetical protein VGF48_06245 [Thermoanaerobaculia bacterium]|jgi:hypothetical protein
MNVRIQGVTVVVKRAAIESAYRGGVAQYRADAPSSVSNDDELLGTSFDSHEEAGRWVEHLRARGVDHGAIALVDATHPDAPPAWLQLQEDGAYLRGGHGGERPFSRFDFLSRSSSGLTYVRDRKGGVMRVLTESELEDFTSPAPCPECAEQFGCEHFNCAGEPLLSESEVATEVPRQWSVFATENGVSRGDLERLRAIEIDSEGEYRVTPGTSADMRMLELVLLLNEAR